MLEGKVLNQSLHQVFSEGTLRRNNDKSIEIPSKFESLKKNEWIYLS